MPEGDNIKRVATVLSREIAGQMLDKLELNDLGEVKELAGKRIESVEPLGKQMFVHIESGWSLRIHLGMHGTWLRKHARQAKPPRWTAVLTVGEVAYVCARSYKAELLKTHTIRHHPKIARLGPDLLAEPPDIDEAVRRALVGAHANREIGDLIMDQRIAAGIGNIYKSETLFECRIHPRTPMRDLSADQLRAIYQKGAHLMRLNLLTRGRTTVPLRRRPEPTSQKFWVYGRKGEPCLDCGTPIERFLQGDMARSTYYCPTCQATPASARSPDQR